ncbi:MAG TPA: trypsin-like serine protease, partial [Polyangiaceae bacterium]|nr:trypsin-like serine protease [Polyangiaceae bacterium]
HPGNIERREIPEVRVIDVAKSDSLDDANATTPRRTFAVAGGTACFGDSGGPALSMTSGALVGVYSRITGDCFAVESRNTFMQAASFSDLFTRAFELVGEQPALEPGPEAPPSSGAAGAPATAPAPQDGRHEAFRCAVAVPGDQSGSSFGATSVFALVLFWLTRRRREKSPF